jgi:hypothetical protein
MHPDPKHLKNFARKIQWVRGKSVRNIAFFSRSQRPGFERLKARGLVCHLIRAIGHHIVRLACRSVSIMACFTACLGGSGWTGRRELSKGRESRRTAKQQTCWHTIRSAVTAEPAHAALSLGHRNG